FVAKQQEPLKKVFLSHHNYDNFEPSKTNPVVIFADLPYEGSSSSVPDAPAPPTIEQAQWSILAKWAEQGHLVVVSTTSSPPLDQVSVWSKASESMIVGFNGQPRTEQLWIPTKLWQQIQMRRGVTVVPPPSPLLQEQANKEKNTHTDIEQILLRSSPPT